MSDSEKGRRRFLRSAAVAGGVIGLAGAGNATAQEDDEYVQTFELIGRRSGWEGVAPEAIEGEQNPTLELEEVGGQYRVIWENGDGQSHNFVIEGDDGEEFVSTDLISSGEQTVEFEAAEGMSEYYCQPHPSRMRGDVAAGESNGDGNGEGNGDGNGEGNGNGNGEGNGNGSEDARQELIDESDFVLEGYTADGWVGVAPDGIADEENPTLEVEDGEEYTIGWINGDGDPHNIAIWDADDEALESTDNVEEEGATQTLTFEASAETASYVCEIHANTMIGELDVQGVDQSDDGGDDGGSDDGDGGDEGGEGDDGGNGDSIPGFGTLTGLVGVGAGAAAAKRLRGDSGEE